jgi:DNA-binding NarL/FixJ family response regulator
MTSKQATKRKLIIQDRSRLFRECCKIAIEATSNILVQDLVQDDVALVLASVKLHPNAIIFETGNVPWDLSSLISQLIAKNDTLTLVGINSNEYRSEAIDRVTLVARSSQIVDLVEALLGTIENSPAVSQTGNPLFVDMNNLLTEREHQVLVLIASGFTTHQIAGRLHISTKTVESRRQSLFFKLDVQNQSHAVAVAARGGLLAGTSVNSDAK